MLRSSTSDDLLFTPQQVGAMLRARRGLIFLIVLLAVVAAVIVNALAPRVWTSSSDIYIEFRDQDPITSRSLSALLDSNYLQTQINLIQSTAVAERLIENENLRDTAEFHDLVQRRGFNQANNLLLEKVRDSIAVSSAGDSRVLVVSFSAASPTLARDFANATVKAYMDVGGELTANAARIRREQYYAQLDALRKEVETLHTTITEYRLKEGIFTSEEHQIPEWQRLEELNNTLLQLQAKRVETAARTAVIQRALENGFNVEDFPEIGRLPQMIELRAQLNAATAQLQEAQATLGANHPRVVALRREIGTFQRAIRQEMEAALVAQTHEIPILEAQEAALTEEIEKQRERAAAEMAHRERLASYQRQLATAEQIYNAALQNYDEMLLASNIHLPNISVLRTADLPATPSRPRPLANLIVSLILGIVLAVSVALLLELLRRRVRCVDDIVRGSHSPLLGHIGDTSHLDARAA